MVRPSSASITALGLGKAFSANGGRTIAALEDVSFFVAPGEFATILGPSGCGKTTLLRIVAGLDLRTSGELTVGGETEGSPVNAMVFQGNAVFPWMTVLDNVGYGLRMRGVRRSERNRVSAGLLRKVGLSEFAGAYPYQISEGMRQRVNIARALAVEPDILLMDEPFSSLDEQNRLLMHQEVLEVWQGTGKTVLFVTHSIDEALVLGDRVLVMTARPGRIKAAVDVPFDRPREVARVRADPRFPQLSLYLWDLLREEVLAARKQEQSR